MMLLVGGEKGGTGKTTLAVNLASMRACHGRDVLLVDTDPQGSASYWAQTRVDDGRLARVSSVQKFGKGLVAALKDLSLRYEDVIVDAGGARLGGIAGSINSRRVGVAAGPGEPVRFVDAGALVRAR